MKRKHLALSQQLSSVPVRNESVSIAKDEDGDLVVEVKLLYTGLLRVASILLKMRKTKRFVLEGLGLQIYESIDGEKSFEDLIDGFAAEHKLTFFEARALLMQYMQILMKNGLVAIGVRRRDGISSALPDVGRLDRVP